jgi:hypothetical protein
MNNVTEKPAADRSGFFLGIILVALVVVVYALMLAATRPSPDRAAIHVNHVASSWLAKRDFRPAAVTDVEPIRHRVIEILWA